MYSCDRCNELKGDRSPPPAARQKGLRFFRPDTDAYDDHFDCKAKLLEGKTPTGEFTIDMIDLNRLALQRLRDARRRLVECDAAVESAIASLQQFPIDRLPTHAKGVAARLIAEAAAVRDNKVKDLDALLERHARSPFADPDPGSIERAKDRSRKLVNWNILYPGIWRAPRKARRSKPQTRRPARKER